MKKKIDFCLKPTEKKAHETRKKQSKLETMFGTANDYFAA